MKTNNLFSIILMFFFLNIVNAQDPCVSRSWQNSYTTSWILNDGGNGATHIPHTITSLAVLPNGTVATSCPWEEGGANVVVYKADGTFQSKPPESGTGSWGRQSLGFVALDNNYSYHLQSLNGCNGGNNTLNSNGLANVPTCGDGFTWRAVRRNDLLTGNDAPFPLGYGGARDLLVVHAGAGDLKGIAIYKNELFVSDELGDSVKVYDKTSMSSVALRKFKFAGGIGALSPDKTGGMWMFQPKLNKIIQFDKTTGAVTGKEITFAAGIVPTAFFVDTIANRILVTDNGVNQNIRIYTLNGTGNYTYSSDFGAQGGMFSGVQGKYAPLKFFELNGVGADAQGNIYVGNSSLGYNGAVLQAYKADGTLLWDKKGLVFVNTACPDPLYPEDVYCVDKKVKVDYSKTIAGSEWSLDAITFNRFKYPDDPRNHNQFSSPWVKYIKGQKFLFMTDMYGAQLAGFRFSPSTDGEVAIPCFLMNIGVVKNPQDSYPIVLGTKKDYMWMDKNGDGAMQSDEFTYLNGYFEGMSSWVDGEGNLWKEIGRTGIRFIPLKEVNSVGVPIYDFADSKLLNLGNNSLSLTGAKRIVFDSELDELYLIGFSNVKPDVKPDGTDANTWWCQGSTICMYKDVLKTLRANPSIDFRNTAPTWRTFIPFAYGSENNSKSFTVGGDYVFVAVAKKGIINVYKRSNGEYVGQITPGPEVSKQSGWTDINYAINVLKTPTEYLIFNEEDGYAKVIMYRMKNLATNDIIFPDLIPADLKILNSSNEIANYLEVNKPLHFSLKVKNIGPGSVPAGSTFPNKRSFLIKYTLKDLNTGSLTTILTDTCRLAIASGDSLQFTTREVNFILKQGEFSISAYVNPTLGANVKECNTTNNTYVFTTNNFDLVQVIKNPLSKTVLFNKNVSFSIRVLGEKPITYQWFVNGAAQANSNDTVFSIINVPYSLNQAKIKCVATNNLGNVTSAEAILTVIRPFVGNSVSSLLEESWYNISGTRISDLVNSPNFSIKPDSVNLIDKFEIKSNTGDFYGKQVSGWLIAPETGNYTFYIASDDNGQLWLSTDSLPQNLGSTAIASVPGYTASRQYTKFPSQTSAPIALVANKKYYVVAMMKDNDGDDNLAVAWKLPSGSTESPIPSSRLAYYSGVETSVENLKDNNTSTLRIYPNPASNNININASGLSGLAKLSIVNLQGQVLFTRTVNGEDLIKQDVSTFTSGIYFITIHSNDKVFRAKFIIDRTK